MKNTKFIDAFFLQAQSREQELSFYFLFFPPFLFRWLYSLFINTEPKNGAVQFIYLGKVDNARDDLVETMRLLDSIDIAPDDFHYGIYSYKDYINNVFYDPWGQQDYSGRKDVIRVKEEEIDKFRPRDSLKTFLMSKGISKMLLPWIIIVAKIQHPVDDRIFYAGL